LHFYDFVTLFIAACIICDKIVNVGNSESLVQITDLRASSEVADLRKAAFHSRCNICRKLPLEADGSHNASKRETQHR
jgi:hypothetical protein